MALHILFTRHGETQDNIDRVLQGHRDTSLTAQGHADAVQLAAKLTSLYPAGVHALYHSPLLRIRQTIAPYLATFASPASDSAAASGDTAASGAEGTTAAASATATPRLLPPPDIYAEPDLMGQCLGELEGASYNTIDMSSPRSADAAAAEGVEVFDAFVGRLRRVFARIVGGEVAKMDGDGDGDGVDRIVMVATHGVGITSLFKALEASPHCDNFGPAVARRGSEAWEVRWTDADDVARIVVPRPRELPLRDGVVDWDAVEGTPFVIEDWGKKEKAL